MKLPLYVGIDGGGSKTAVALLDATGKMIGRGEAGPANLATSPPGCVHSALTEAMHSALQSAGLPGDIAFQSVCAGMAGYVVLEQRKAFLHLLKTVLRATHYAVQPDYVVALWGASGGGPGVCVSAGTGVVVYGRNRAGRQARADGNGFLLGDAGGGFYLGIRALRHTLSKMEGGHKDRLAAAVAHTIGAQNRDMLVDWVYHPMEPGRIARLAGVVGNLADEGVPQAQHLLRQAARHLWRSAKRVLTDLSEGDELPLYLTGGLWHISPLLRTYFLQAASSSASQTVRFALAEPLADAAVGAALLALRGGVPEERL